ncbi:hypothetical protein OY671_012101, partial [Metschnikowia pulcherrima]
ARAAVAAQRDGMDGAEGPGAGVSAGERGRGDGLYNAGSRLGAGMADSRRAHFAAAGGRHGDGHRRTHRDHATTGWRAARVRSAHLAAGAFARRVPAGPRHCGWALHRSDFCGRAGSGTARAPRPRHRRRERSQRRLHAGRRCRRGGPAGGGRGH